ncbi:putative transcription factor B3-Domain family [Helianthus anomalus]
MILLVTRHLIAIIFWFDHGKCVINILVQYVPINFVRANRLSTGGMILRYGQSETSWMAELRSHANSYIIGGSHDFYIENGLKEGDHFKLELIQSGTKPFAIFYNISYQLSS